MGAAVERKAKRSEATPGGRSTKLQGPHPGRSEAPRVGRRVAAMVLRVGRAAALCKGARDG